MICKAKMLHEIKESGKTGSWTHALTKIMVELAEGVASHRIFKTHNSKQDLIQDGLVHLLEIWEKYNVENTVANPFGYFTRSLFRFYGKQLKKEIRYSEIKNAILDYNDCLDFDDSDL